MNTVLLINLNLPQGLVIRERERKDANQQNKYGSTERGGFDICCYINCTVNYNNNYWICQTLQQLGISSGSGEVIVQQKDGDEQLDQAYTCVTMKTDTEDYIGTLESNTSRVVPLKGTGAFNKVSIEWFAEADLKDDEATGSPGTVQLPDSPIAELPKLADWNPNTPAFIRSQFIQYGSSFSLSDFDSNQGSNSNTNTVFLYPSKVGRNTDDGVASHIPIVDVDPRKKSGNNILQQVVCKTDFATSQYACRAILTLPQAIGESNDVRGAAYLRLNAIYNSGNNFRVQLFKDNTNVKFAGVQALVDSTGRANELFRRIQSRVELDVSAFPYPEAAVDITGNLCKTFLVTDNPDDFDEGACKPDEYTTR
ncbi:MAG: hypothetical protein EOO17_00180 [Chloroflexi bacterium]|nr:MAG: hypothetical protein EOO17_00180 [Chloroflexota bacterium]